MSFLGLMKRFREHGQPHAARFVKGVWNAERGTVRADARRRDLWRLCVTLVLLGGCSEAETIHVPVVYVVAGRVLDPATSPVEGIAGAKVRVDTDASVMPVTTDADGNFVVQGVSSGTHRLRVELAGRRTTLTYDFVVRKNVADALVPLFTDHEIDSVLTANGAPAWDRGQALFGVFALRSNGVPLGDATLSFQSPPGGTLVQTGQGKDPIVVVNANATDATFSLTRSGYVWDGPYGAALRPGVLVFAAPRARPNLNGFVLADNASGAQVGDATVATLEGPTAASTTTNFLGQFSLVGLSAGRYVARIDAGAGFLPTLTWPQPLDQDTTLTQIVVHSDTLAAWAAPTAINGARGHVRIDVRDAIGAVIDGATVEVTGGDAAGSVSIAQTQGAPALRINLLPGYYSIVARIPGGDNSPATDSVQVRAGEITSTRIDFLVLP